MKTTPRVIGALELFADINIETRKKQSTKHPTEIKIHEANIDYLQAKLDLELNDMTLEERADFLLDTFRG